MLRLDCNISKFCLCFYLNTLQSEIGIYNDTKVVKGCEGIGTKCKLFVPNFWTRLLTSVSLVFFSVRCALGSLPTARGIVTEVAPNGVSM